MSHFMSPILSDGLIEMPPESNVTPLPTRTTGFSPFFPPRCSRMTNRGSSAAPRLTARRPPIRSASICFFPRTVAFTPRFFAAAFTASANIRGTMSFDGVFPRSRTNAAIAATFEASTHPSLSSFGEAPAKTPRPAGRAISTSLPGPFPALL